MTNFFALLGLPESLGLDPVAVERSWREKSRSLGGTPDRSDPDIDHPDLNQARTTLADPALRLAHWLALRAPEAPADRRIDPALMDLFSTISPVLAKTDQLLARHRRATTALAKAMLTREAIDATIADSRNCCNALQPLEGRESWSSSTRSKRRPGPATFSPPPARSAS